MSTESTSAPSPSPDSQVREAVLQADRARSASALGAQSTAIGIAAFLAIAKTIVYGLTGSVSVLASAADSALDIAASSLNYLAVRLAAAPPDDEHSYGHGKFEAVAGIFQAGVVVSAGIYLLYASVRRFVDDQPLANVGLGIAVMSVSVVASLVITYVLRRAARRTGSLAVAGDALHYMSDVGANLATILGLALVSMTGQTHWDPLIALFLTAYLLHAAWGVFLPAWNILVDHQLSPAERRLIEVALQLDAPPEVVGYYALRTRSTGQRILADVRVVFHTEVAFTRIHDITEELEERVAARFDGNAEVVIHPEPLGAHGLEHAPLTWRRPDSLRSRSPSGRLLDSLVDGKPETSK